MIYLNRLLTICLLSIWIVGGYGQTYPALPVIRSNPLDLQGGGIWNWDQRLDQGWINIVINGDFAVWSNGNDTIPDGWSHSYAEVNCDVSREETNYKSNLYAMRVTSNGSGDAYTDYRFTFRKEYRNRYMTVGLDYFCPEANDKTQMITFFDDRKNVYKDLEQDGTWHRLKLTMMVTDTASYLGIRVVVNSGGGADTDDYLIIDNLSLYEGRVLPRWTENTWDFLSRYGFTLANRVSTTGIQLKNYYGSMYVEALGGATFAGINGLGITSTRAAGANNNGLILQHVGAPATSIISWKWSVRDNDEDIWLYGYNGTMAKNFMRYIWDDSTVVIGDTLEIVDAIKFSDNSIQTSAGGGGGGDITSVNVSAPVTGGGITGAVTIGVDTSDGNTHLATQYYVSQNDDENAISIRGKPVSDMTPVDGYALTYNTVKDSIIYTSVGGGAGGDITAVYVNAPVTGGGATGDVTVSVDTSSGNPKLATQYFVASSIDTTDGTNTSLATQYDITNIDVSEDVNLTAGSGIVLTGDALSHSTAAPYKHIPASGSSTQLLQYSASGIAKWISMTGDASIADGGVITVDDNSHSHTGTTISGLDISDDTNLSASVPATLIGDVVGVDTTDGNANLSTQYDDLVLRNDFEVGYIYKTLVNPDSLSFSGDKLKIWSNGHGSTIIIDSIKCTTDRTTQSYLLTFQETVQWDSTTVNTIDAVIVATSGTGVYYQKETTISHATIENTNEIWIKYDTSKDIRWLTFEIYYTW